MQKLSIDERVHLITRNLEEILGADEAIAKMKTLLQEKDELRIYWGTAPTGKPHIAYFVPMSKLADFLRAGCHVTVLFADLHAYLDNMKAPWELLKLRTDYYEAAIQGMLSSIGVPLDKLHFVRGTDFELTAEYSMDVHKLTARTTAHDSKKAGAEVVRQVSSPAVSLMVYPLLQALDEEHLKCDAQFGGKDQRKIFTFAEKMLPKIGYKKRIHLMNPMVPGLTGAKMSSSEANSKIDLLDSEESVREKILGAVCEPGVVEGNGVLAFCKMVLFPLVPDGGKFELASAAGQISFTTYQELEAAFTSGTLQPADLKLAVFEKLNALLEPVRAKFRDDPRLARLAVDAYPPVVKGGIEPIVDLLAAAVAAAPSAQASSAAGGESAAAGAPQKASAPAAASAPVAAAAAVPDIEQVDIRVGRVVSVQKHPDVDKFYILNIDVADKAPRMVVSGLAKQIPANELENRLVCVLANPKPARMKNLESTVLLLTALNADESVIELLDPPAGSVPGDRIGCGRAMPAGPILPVASEKVFKAVMSGFKVDAQLQTTWNGTPLVAPQGVCTVKSLADAKIRFK